MVQADAAACRSALGAAAAAEQTLIVSSSSSSVSSSSPSVPSVSSSRGGSTATATTSVALEDALLELVGYASRQQRLWQVWALCKPAAEDACSATAWCAAPCLEGETPLPVEKRRARTTARPPPLGAELTVGDARVVRQNCATVLAMVMSVLSSSASESWSSSPAQALASMRETPESVVASAKVLAVTIERKRERAACEARERRKAATRGGGGGGDSVDQRPPKIPEQRPRSREAEEPRRRAAPEPRLRRVSRVSCSCCCCCC